MFSSGNVGKLREERVHGTDSFPCGLYRCIGDTESLIVKYHWHKECEIIYFIEGEFDVGVNMEKYHIAGECLCFINSGELHNIESTNAPYEEHAIVFLPELIRFKETGWSDSQIVDPFVENKINLPRILTPLQKGFEEIKLEFLQAEYSMQNTVKDSFNQLLIKASILKIIAYLEKEKLFTFNEEKLDSRVEHIKNVIYYIEQNYQGKIYIKDLSQIANMNEQYFCRFFKSMIGKTCVEYVNEYRIKQAKKLLLETRLSVTEISMECGFNNIGNFLKEFKKITDFTPLKYRNFYHIVVE